MTCACVSVCVFFSPRRTGKKSANPFGSSPSSTKKTIATSVPSRSPNASAAWSMYDGDDDQFGDTPIRTSVAERETPTDRKVSVSSMSASRSRNQIEHTSGELGMRETVATDFDFMEDADLARKLRTPSHVPNPFLSKSPSTAPRFSDSD